MAMTAARARKSDVLSGARNKGAPNVELLTLRWYWWAQTYTSMAARGSLFIPGLVTTEPLKFTGRFDDTWYQFEAGSDRKLYRVSSNTAENLWGYLQHNL
jgi:hypothetical protein